MECASRKQNSDSLTYFGICYKSQCHFLIIMSDFGLLDCIIQDVNQDVVISQPPMTETELEFNDILSESSESSNDNMQNDILSASIQQSGINATSQGINRLVSLSLKVGPHIPFRGCSPPGAPWLDVSILGNSSLG